MSDNFDRVFAPVEGLNGGDGGVLVRQVATADLSRRGVPMLTKAPGRGKLSLVKFGTFEATCDLIPTGNAEDDHPRELWKASQRPTMVNIGSHRVGHVGVELTFVASNSFRNLGGLVPDPAFTWDFGNGDTATGVVAVVTYDAPGLYEVTCTADEVSTTRWVRVLAGLEDDSVLQVVGVENLGADSEGWTCTVQVAGDYTQLSGTLGIGLYVHDLLELRWRGDYETRVRGIALRTSWNTQPPPAPQEIELGPDGQPVDPDIGETGTWSEGMPSFNTPDWIPINVYNNIVAKYADRRGVPANLIKAILYCVYHRTWWIPFDGTTCFDTYGPMEVPYKLGQSCTIGNYNGWDLGDPDAGISAGAKELRLAYNTCQGGWMHAVMHYIERTCTPEGRTSYTARTDLAQLGLVWDRWNELDQAAIGNKQTPMVLAAQHTVPGLPQSPVNPYTGTSPGIDPQYGELVFFGYVDDASLKYDATTHTTTVNLVSLAGKLKRLRQRVEHFWEAADKVDHGGTILGVPLKMGLAVQHTLQAHTNVCTRHDVLIDFSGPRLSSLTANEGSVWSNISSWAQNDFAMSRADRLGRLHYHPKMQYRGKTFADEINMIAPIVAPELILRADVSERNMSSRVSWVKLTSFSKGCAQVGEYPCGGPPTDADGGHDGRWVYDGGLWYDDAKIMCAMAAHHYAFANRAFDAEIEIPWRHDIEIGDVIRLPLVDPSGRFDWRKVPRTFVVNGIKHAIDLAGASWVTTLSLEQLTYGTPCACRQNECPEYIYPDPGPIPPPGGGGFPDFPDPGGGFPDWPGGMPPWDEPNWGSGLIPEVTAWVDGWVRYHQIGNGQFYEAWTEDVSGTPSFYSESAVGYKDWGRVEENTCLMVTVTGPLTALQPLTIAVGPGFSGFPVSGSGDRVHFLQPTVPFTKAALRWLRVRPTAAHGDDPDENVNVLGLPPDIDAWEGNATGFADGVSFLPVYGRYGLGLAPDGFFDHPLAQGGTVPWHDLDGQEHALYEVDGQSVGDELRGFADESDFGDTQLGGILDRVLGEGTTDDLADTLVNSFADAFDPIHPSGVTYTLVLPAHPQGASYLIGYEIVEHGKPSEEVTKILLQSPTHAAQGREDINQRMQPYQGFGIGALRLGFQLAWEPPEWASGMPPSGFGDGDYTGSDGLCPGFPTAGAIDNRIALSETQNGRASKLHGMGDTILGYGQEYGLNPAVVVAIMQRECQLGADGSLLPVGMNNFGGLTGTGPCGTQIAGGHSWKVFCSPAEGVEAIFAQLAGSAYTNTDGTLRAVMNVFSPVDETDWPGLWATFAEVGNYLGVPLTRETLVYTDHPECVAGGSGIPEPGPDADGYSTLFEYALRQSGAVLTQGPYMQPTHSRVDAYDIAMANGRPLYPIAEGRVSLGADTIYGNFIDLTCRYGVIRYGHLFEFRVSEGQVVTTKTLLGLSDNSGLSTGPHLHLEVRGGTSNMSLQSILAACGINIMGFPRRY